MFSDEIDRPVNSEGGAGGWEGMCPLTSQPKTMHSTFYTQKVPYLSLLTGDFEFIVYVYIGTTKTNRFDK